ncbi:HSP90-domain-containing protein [Gymnopus androsaceus JB14]|uniref:HSP90-domain-containing protein n=1 Tax=Gymnopus androsaceus JB14 TaxID=1447944 RepID=A0A6A4IIW1_9AGAR|nr:HSP90-domain-containing protein [Gymnopus androsaceus JB14]
MSAPFAAFGPPPLPSGWTEHQAPGGPIYYYNSQTKESTYIRPLPTFQSVSQPKSKSKLTTERPFSKTQIPGTDWIRVKTTEGNVFYSNKVKKQSLWTVPDEIKNTVAQLEKDEMADKGNHSMQAEEMLEVERVKAQIKETVKRKAQEDAQLDEVVITKKAKTEDAEEQVEEEEEEEESEEEEEWQREAAAQLAAEAEEEKKLAEEEVKREAESELQRAKESQIVMPDKVDLSLEEAKALFKTLLREKDINPLHPWDTSLPKFVSDPRYVLLPSVSARREAFDEYCRDRARELRRNTVSKETRTPKEDYEDLLNAEVKSTRTSWTEFRRTWKKDRRYYGWGRDDREREKAFRDFIRDLGEKKKAAAQKAEADFFDLLKERAEIKEGCIWKEVKKDLVKDPRYDAVGSSSLREELFNSFVNAKFGNSLLTTPTNGEEQRTDELAKSESKKEKKERAVKEREEKVRFERERLEANTMKSRMELNKEEGEREFNNLLTDAIRDPQISWQNALPQLQTDPRIHNSPLPLNQQLHLFHEHVSNIRSKHLKGLEALFQSHAPSLATTFDDLPVPSILSSLPATKLGLGERGLQQEFEKWQRERSYTSRKAFDEMLAENSFVEFWGRLGKIGGEGVHGGVKADDDDEESQGLGTKVDMKELAKSVDVEEMEKVLRNDKRYIMFDHIPEQREQWIRNYLSQLSAPKLVVIQLWLTQTIARSVKMRLLHTFLLLSPLFSLGLAQGFDAADIPKKKFDYQSDVARMRKIVINSLYSHKEIFLRELISNANDAIEKLRLTALIDKTVWDGTDPLNITIKAVRNEDGKGGKLIISDTGIGMGPDELSNNLGTLAKSGTSEFLAGAEGADGTATGNLIGAFGLGFYSSFLVAEKVHVASVPAKSEKYPEPAQYVFSSSAEDSSFEIFPDPRGNTLKRGTEITLELKDDSFEYLEVQELTALVSKHSSYSTSFPIYLFTQRTEEVLDEDALAEETSPAEDTLAEETSPAEEKTTDVDEDEAIIEDVDEDSQEQTPAPPKMKSVVVDEWVHLNGQPPIWVRDPKEITDEEYTLFYNAFFKDFSGAPMNWTHFSGDSESGVSFKAIVYLPGSLPDAYWQQPLLSQSKDVKLMVKRVFITNDLGEDSIPKWASWVKVVVDAEDLPLNVSRETLQSTAFLRQLRSIILKRIIQLFTKLSELQTEDQEKFEAFYKTYGGILKLGAVEDLKNREKLAAMVRFTTTQRNYTSLDQYLENRKQGQKQIFYLGEVGEDPKELAKSVFVEKLHARGYEVLLVTEPLDEVFITNIRRWQGVPFQNIAKVGLKFGDEDLDEEEEKAQQKEAAKKFKPLMKYLRQQGKGVIRDVVISNRLVTSPVAIVADSGGYTANYQKIMGASTAGAAKMNEYAMKARVLEINPRSPLIEGLLRRVEALPTEEEGRDIEAEEELEEVASILLDGALIRSGFEVPSTNDFFGRVDRVLRRSLGVSEHARTDDSVKPAPPVDPELPPIEELYKMPPKEGEAGIYIPPHMQDDMDIEMEEVDEFGNLIIRDADGNIVEVVHDEL